MSMGEITDIPEELDVLIAGGGPTGLFLALDLAARGVSSAVVEPRRVVDRLRPRAKTTNARTMTHLRRLGLADRLRAIAPLDAAYADRVVFCTGLNGDELRDFPRAVQLQSERYDLAPETGQQIPQPMAEQLFREAVADGSSASLHLGVRYRTSQVAAGGGRLVTLEDDAGRIRSVHCRYLVGADGIASTVRKDVGLRLEGSSATKSNLGLVFRAPQLADRVTLAPAVQFWVTGREYAGMIGQLDLDGMWWAIVQGYDPEAPRFTDVSRGDLVRSLTGIDTDVEVLAEDPWTARMLLADGYLADGVALAGEAAHSNPPSGGHGFNTGIGDAANLAWKLAARIHGWAGPALLDSYEEERRPVARRTIDEATANTEVQADDLMSARLHDPGPAGAEARTLANRALVAKETEFYALGLVFGYDYGRSGLVTPAGSPAPPAHPIDYHPTAAPGCLVPHIWLDESTSLYDRLGPDFTVLIDAASPAADRAAEFVATTEASGIPAVVRTVTVHDHSLSEAWEAPVVLVRPDQHVAWRGSEPAELGAALRRAAGHLTTEPRTQRRAPAASTGLRT